MPVYRCDWCGKFYTSALPEGSACRDHIPEHNARLTAEIAKFNQRVAGSSCRPALGTPQTQEPEK